MLEMKVYKEISDYEPKPMFGRTWRQIGALAVMVFFGGGLFAVLVLALVGTGQSLSSATNVGMYVLFPVLIPAAMWGWWRPKGLMPEKFLGYFFRHHFTRKVIPYVDVYQRVAGRAEPVFDAAALESSQPQEPRRGHPARKKWPIVSEHSEAEGKSARKAR